MKLPRLCDAKIAREKLTNYLLNFQHPYGAGKAAFFSAYGFTLVNWEKLAEALLEHAAIHDVAEVIETKFGPRYQIDGPLLTTVRYYPVIRSIWQWDHGQLAPRFITAYPLKS